ncbi:MAG: hypothetical protein COW16_12265 [Sphingomonadales bacterium CG12_big_fil_rev_8_21_14_0_65_65_10]|nr:MAG: hypothetical protein COW16_12265 [Sphingomonadales bacterium CG12_big_fil_rev_8_21_14_0_65_65_10]
MKSAGSTSKTPAKETSRKPRETKIGKVIAVLKRKEGATLDEMIEATGWLPHTTRAALTSLKKKGHTIKRDKRGDTTCYRITKTA